ncbi:hypothetical protein GJ496_005961 [Pomphorhynchus laevis]|nr:hypothetical protein GJ496_005961 [Pomphorhynchus laevis]
MNVISMTAIIVICTGSMLVAFKLISFSVFHYSMLSKYGTSTVFLYGISTKAIIGSLYEPWIRYKYNYRRSIRHAYLLRALILTMLGPGVISLINTGFSKSYSTDEAETIELHNFIRIFRQQLSTKHTVGLLKCTVPAILFIPVVCLWVFDGIAALLAEITGTYNCRFYLDWFSAQTQKEFWRRWNRLTGELLIAFVFKPCLKAKLSKTLSVVITFVVSAVLHQFIFIIAFGPKSYVYSWGILIQPAIIHYTEGLKRLPESTRHLILQSVHLIAVAILLYY